MWLQGESTSVLTENIELKKTPPGVSAWAKGNVKVLCAHPHWLLEKGLRCVMLPWDSISRKKIINLWGKASSAWELRGYLWGNGLHIWHRVSCHFTGRSSWGTARVLVLKDKVLLLLGYPGTSVLPSVPLRHSMALLLSPGPLDSISTLSGIYCHMPFLFLLAYT